MWKTEVKPHLLSLMGIGILWETVSKALLPQRYRCLSIYSSHGLVEDLLVLGHWSPALQLLPLHSAVLVQRWRLPVHVIQPNTLSPCSLSPSVHTRAPGAECRPPLTRPPPQPVIWMRRSSMHPQRAFGYT